MFAYLIADISSVNEVDQKGLTPIIWAAAYGQLAVLNLLHAHGADPHYKGPAGENALAFAAANGHSHIISHLLAWGVNVDEVDEVLVP